MFHGDSGKNILLHNRSLHVSEMLSKAENVNIEKEK